MLAAVAVAVGGKMVDGMAGAGPGSALGKDGSRGVGILTSFEAPGGMTGNDSQSFSSQWITIAARVDRATDTGNGSGSIGGT